MSEEKRYVEFTVKMPDDDYYKSGLKKAGENMYELLSESSYKDALVNGDIVIRYDVHTPNEIYLAFSEDLLSNPENDVNGMVNTVFYAFNNVE